ncbi:hypothetical protein [Leucobacter sp. M11]|uniref:hypothetical protein n=1 Tax=Leucobacter sp. M11 TaxID=2993565 RepID=UPI002D7F98A9|nr:hypothetical protein [Leucobacter sp. M11]MEB4614030.1 hypothetical protein [Leucobacter sp. M11]
MTDHKQAAITDMEHAFQTATHEDLLTGLQMAAAQVHATLHLAEQQRIANLIALATPQETFDGGTVCLPSWVYREVLDYDGEPIVGAHELRPEIRAALGLDG